MNKAMVAVLLLLAGCGEVEQAAKIQHQNQEQDPSIISQAEIDWACNERKTLKENKVGYERVLTECLKSAGVRHSTGTDDQADIINECKLAAREVYFIHGYLNAQEAALTKAKEVCP